MNKDLNLTDIQRTQSQHTQDMEFMSDEGSELSVKQSKKGTSERFEVPDISASNQIWRVRQGLGALNKNQISFYLPLNNEIIPILVQVQVQVTSFTNFKTDVESALAFYGITATVTRIGSDTEFASIEMSGTWNFVKAVQIIDYTNTAFGIGTTYPCYVLQDYIALGGQMKPLQSVTIGKKCYTLSIDENNQVTELGFADEGNDWTYTRLLKTASFTLSETHPITLRSEQQSDGTYAFYFTDNTIKPKCIYVPPSLTQDCCLVYTTSSYLVESDGSYFLNNTDEQTNHQLINNILYAEITNQIQGGGSLVSGGWRYALRCGLANTKSVTSWSILSNIIPVFVASIEAPLSWINVQGDPSGTKTSKINIITVKNAKSDVFSFVELSAVHYTSENTMDSFYIGKYDVSGDEFTIQHTGSETGIFPMPNSELLDIAPVILNSKSLEIKKGRINFPNVDVATEDDAFMTIAENCTLSHEKFEVEPTGEIAAAANLVFSGKILNDITNSIGTSQQKYVHDLVFSMISVSVLSPNTYSNATATFTVLNSNATPNLNINISGFLGTRFITEKTSYVQIIVFKNGNVVVEDTLLNQPLQSAFINRNYTVTTAINDTIRVGYLFYDQDTDDQYLTTDDDALNVKYYQGSNDTISQFSNTNVGEYQLPLNVANKGGYMLNEYYPFFLVFALKNGYITSAYPIGKLYGFDNPDFFVRGLYKLERDTDDMAVYSDSSYPINTVYNYNIKISNLDISSVINQVAGVYVYRGNPLNAVVGTGIFMQSKVVEGEKYTCGVGKSGHVPAMSTAVGTAYFRKFGVFLSPDIITNTPKFNVGDVLETFGYSGVYNLNESLETGAAKFGAFYELSGYIEGAPTVTSSEINDATYNKFGMVGRSIYNNGSGTALKLTNTVADNAISNAEGMALTITDELYTGFNPYSAFQLGTSLAQYTRTMDVSTYDYKSETPFPTGDFLLVDESITSYIQTIDVYGGDTYTQKNIRKIASWYIKKIDDDTTNVDSSYITYYAQNRNNFQLNWTDISKPEDTFNLQAAKSNFDYLFPFGDVTEVVDEQHNFDASYIGKNIIGQINTFNDKIPYVSVLPSTIYYSEKKLQNSEFDAYRKIRLLNFAQLEMQKGAISALYDVREVMVAIQTDAVVALPYDTDTFIKTDQSASVFIGSGAVYANYSIPLSSYGTSLNSNSIKGFNRNGNPTIYWYSENYQKLFRYDYDGVKCISDDNFMRSWFLENTKFIQNEFDVNLYFNTRKQDMCVTSRAQKEYTTWSSLTSYTTGDVVSYGAEGQYRNYMELPTIYIAMNSNSNKNPFIYRGIWWEEVPTTDENYYNYWSLIFNEYMNVFTTFITPLQQRYFRHNNLTLTPKGVSSFGRVYEMDSKDAPYLQYFEEDGNEVFGTSIITPSINILPSIDKTFLSVGMERGDNTIIDSEITASSGLQESTLTTHELRSGITYYPVQPDNNGDNLKGQYLLLTIVSDAYLKIRSLFVNFYQNSK